MSYSNDVLLYNNFLSLDYSVHYFINLIKNWGTGFEYFINSRLLKSLSIIHKNRLKNIVNKFTCNDTKMWLAIEKMIYLNMVSFSDPYIYRDNSAIRYSLLSNFLLNIYLLELDFFVTSFSTSYNIKSFVELNFKNYFEQLLIFKPVMFDKLALYNSSLRDLNTSKNTFIKKVYTRNVKDIIVFNRSIKYARFLDHFILGLSCSKNFAILLQKKLISFIRSNLHLDLETNYLLSSKSDPICFAGFVFKSYTIDKLNYNLLSQLKTSRKYSNKILTRVNLLNKTVTKTFIARTNSELVKTVKKIFNEKKLSLSHTSNSKFWNYLFQLECVRACQYGKLILSRDGVSLISNEIFYSIKLQNLNKSQEYLFNWYSYKLNLTIKETIIKFSPFIADSVNPIDIYLNSLLVDFRKRLFLIHNSFQHFHLYDVPILADVSTVYGFGSLVKLKAENYLERKNIFVTSKNVCIEVFVSLNFLYSKLCLLGITNSSKKILGVSRLLWFEDYFIIKYFGFLAYSFLVWFSCCKDFSRIKFFVNILRQSCFLTLCRKHNKSKSWVYKVYTSDLNLTINIFSKRLFFPSKKSLILMKRSFWFLRNKVPFSVT